ncbi:hypothetical protein HID58_045950 [Brassica napus]|uniref:Legume lectin domain-containing protein n=1 Tax=Brassica napus TaxID=3708 RepID=A0ABQ8AV54_BRANA|nr:hypothetical protein HID58_045950 [Brassica napus]
MLQIKIWWSGPPGGSKPQLPTNTNHVHVMLLVLAQDKDPFVLYDFRGANLYLDGMANINDSRLHLTNDTETSTGHAMLKVPMNFTASSPSSFSFSTEFVFAIFPLQKPPSYGQGMAFVVASKIDLMPNGIATSGKMNK